MLEYETFKDVVRKEFLSYMPEKYQDMELRVYLVEKVNCTMDGLSLFKVDGVERVSPTIYINDIYDEYLKNGDLQEVLQNAADMLDRAFSEAPALTLEMHTAKDNIIFQLVNTAQNEDMLGNKPHREFQDLSIIYRWVISMDERGISSTVISNNLARELGMDEEQLFKVAMENTRRILPPVVKSMNEVLRDMMLANNMLTEIVDSMIVEMPPEQTMWIITNELSIDGAVSMLYEDKLHKLAESVESDLYLLPSSIHEIIAVPVGLGKPEELAQMVAEINMNHVELSKRLSNQVYHYDKDLRRITLATDTPNKRLDGIATKS